MLSIGWFIHLFLLSKYLLSICYVLGTTLGAGDKVSKTEKNPCPCGTDINKLHILLYGDIYYRAN